MREEIKKYIDADGKIIRFPTKRKLKVFVLYYLIEKFDNTKKYSEIEINEIINNNTCFKDQATLRREMIDYKLLERTLNCELYWVGSNPITLKELGYEA